MVIPGRTAANPESITPVAQIPHHPWLRIPAPAEFMQSSLRSAYGQAKSKTMPNDPTPQPPASSEAAPDLPGEKPALPPAAERALAEAAARRAERERAQTDAPKESGGRDGPEPTRYGDWEKDGLASDF